MTIPRKIWKVGWRYLFRHPWQFGLMIIGIAATILSALPPAWEAASVMPRAALHRSGLENKAQKTINVTALAGFMFFFMWYAAVVAAWDGFNRQLRRDIRNHYRIRFDRSYRHEMVHGRDLSSGELFLGYPGENGSA